MNDELFESQFSMWEYKLPKDPEKMLYDFYFLSHFLNDQDTGDEDLDYSLKQAIKEVADGLQKHMVKAVRWALACEIRHVIDGEGYQGEWSLSRKLNAKTKDFLADYEDSFMTSKKKQSDVSFKKVKKRIDPISNPKAEDYWQKGERLRSYKSIISTLKDKGLNDNDFAEVAQDCFNSLKWDSGYGNKSWGRIAKGWQNLVNAKTTGDKFTWIDHVYDLQHNSDTVFDKVSIYYKDEMRAASDDDTFDDEAGFAWLKDALDWKRDVEEIREYYNLVSDQLKPVVAFTSKKRTQKVIEQPTDSVHTAKMPNWDGKVWRGGTWKNGVWKDGTWERGTWENGNWENGTWENGTWMKGTWENGIWKNGVWKKGYWNNGEWHGGEWLSGSWLKGFIYSKKFDKLIQTFLNPKEFYKAEKKAKNLKELREQH